jgi:hypothetical protein
VDIRPATAALVSTGQSHFKISFKLHRISNTLNRSYQSLAFLFLKSNTGSFYLLSIETNGLLTMKRVQTTDFDDFDLGKPFKAMWSLSNDKINLNSLNASYAVEIGIKFDASRVELTINDTYTSRFELLNEVFFNDTTQKTTKFQVDWIKFKNFNYNTNNNGFVVYDLTINNNHYMFKYRNRSGESVELVLLDQHTSLLELDPSSSSVAWPKSRFRFKNLVLFNASYDDFSIINELNRNNVYCDNKSFLNDTFFNFNK